MISMVLSNSVKVKQNQILSSSFDIKFREKIYDDNIKERKNGSSFVNLKKSNHWFDVNVCESFIPGKICPQP